MFKFAAGVSVFAAPVVGTYHDVKFGPYPGYTGDMKVEGGVEAHYTRDHVYLNYFIRGIEAENCKTAPEGVSNACGIHIHAGTTCDDADAVGGHFYDSDNIDSDPWAPVTYEARRDGSAYAFLKKVTIGEGQDIGGRAMVVHDSTGGRVACALLPASIFMQHSAMLGPYPGYTGDLKVEGSVRAHYYGSRAHISYHLSGVEADNCKTAPEGVSNACGIHIHEGTTCDDADAVGGHYYDGDHIDSDPWAPVGYSAREDSTASGEQSITIGSGQDIGGRAMVVHDSTGGRVACALLPASFFKPQVQFSPYPGYTGDLQVTGSVEATYHSDHVYLNYFIQGVEAKNCKTAPEGVANACGIHIHAGTTCDDADSVGGHYYDSDSIDSDPWAAVTYSAHFDGSASDLLKKITIGKGQNIGGRAMVVHDSTGGRVACAVLPASFFTV